MNAPDKKHYTRWHVCPETTFGLERIRKLSGSKSWDEFFQEIIARADNTPSPSSIKRENLDLKAVQGALDDLRQGQVKILGRLDERNQVEQELVNGLSAEIQDFRQVLRGIKTLLELALQVESSEREAPRSENAEIIRKFLEGK